MSACRQVLESPDSSISGICGNNGYVRREDLASYQAEVRKPIQLESHGYQMALNPPPSIGGAMAGSMVQLYDLLWREKLSAAERVTMREIFDRALLWIASRALY